MKPAHETDGPTEPLGRLLDEALRCLESTDLPGANAALKKVHAEAALSHATRPTGYAGATSGARKAGKRSEDRG